MPGTDAWVEHREFGVRAWVTIDSVEEADIEEGEGCLVLSTVRHTTRGLVRLRLGDASDVVVTATHRFWSSTRHASVSVGALVMGEQVSTESGTQRVGERWWKLREDEEA